MVAIADRISGEPKGRQVRHVYDSHGYAFEFANPAPGGKGLRLLDSAMAVELLLHDDTGISLIGGMPGEVKIWPAAALPTGFLWCDGGLYNQADYPRLFALIGTTYNTGGEAAGTFRVPDYRGFVLGGKDASRFPVLGTAYGNATANLQHSHDDGTLAAASHSHSDGTLAAASHQHDSGTLAAASHQHDDGTLTAANHNHSTPDHQHSGTTGATGDNTSRTMGSGAVTTDVPNSGHTHGFTTNNDGSSVTGGNGADVSGSTGSIGAAVTGNTGSIGADVSGNTGSIGADVSGITGTAGSSTQSLLQPTKAVNFIIKV